MTDTPAQPRRRWLRRAAWGLAILVVLRVVLGLAVGPLLRRAAAGQGVELAYEELDLDLLEGRVELWRVRADLAEEDGEPEPFARLQTLALDLDVPALLGGHVRVRRFELDGGRVELTRSPEGRWNIERWLASGPADEEPEDVEEEDEPAPLSFDPPVELVAARVQDLSVVLRDETVEPPLDASLTLSLTAADVGTPEERARVDLIATSPELLDLLRLHGEGRAEGAEVDLELELEVSRLDLRPVAHLLAHLGIDPRAERLDGRASLELGLRPIDETAEQVRGAVELSDVQLSHDGREAFAVDSLRVDVAAHGSRATRIGELALEGLRARAERMPDGAMGLVGLALGGGGESLTVPEDVTSETTVTENSSEPRDWSVEQLRVSGGLFAFEDRVFDPACETVTWLEELTLGPLSSSEDAPPADVRVLAGVPGVAERGEIVGTVGWVAGRPDVALRFDWSGADLTGLVPYLAPGGIEPVLEGARLRAASLAWGPSSTGASRLSLHDLEFVDAERSWGRLGSLVVETSVDGPSEITVEGARLNVIHEAEGTVAFFGLRFGADPAAGSFEQDEQDPSVAPDAEEFVLAPLELPTVRFAIDELRLVDEATGAPPASIGPFAVELLPAATGAWSLDAAGATDVASEFGLHLDVLQADDGAIVIEGETHAKELDLAPLAPWLELAALEPVIRSGTFEAGLALRVDEEGGRPVLDLGVGPVALAEDVHGARREWLNLEHFGVEGLATGGTTTVEVVELRGPDLLVRRDAEGALELLGVRMPPADSPEPGSTEAPPTPGGPGQEGSEPSTRLARVALEDATVRFEDLAVGEGGRPHVVEVRGDATLTDLAPGAGAQRTNIELELRAAGGQIAASGDLTLDPDDLRLGLDLRAERLSGESLAPYLSPGFAIDLTDGVASARLDARVTGAEAGGQRVRVDLRDLDLRERGRNESWFEARAAFVDVPRLDPEAEVFEVEAVVVEGARLRVLRTSDGGTAALGCRWLPAPGAEEDLAEGSEPTEGSEQATEPDAPKRSVSRITIGRLDVELAELLLGGEGATETSSLSARLSLREPYEFDASVEGAGDAPLGLDFTGRLEPGVESLELAVDLAPFADDPRVDAVLAVRGLDGDGLLAASPDLAEQVDGSALAGGTLDASLQGQLSWRRRGPLDFDLDPGFAAELTVRDLALRAGPDAEIGLGLDLAEATVRRIAPRTGSVHVARLELDTPRGRVRRTDRGTEVAGLTFLAPTEEETVSPVEPAVEPAEEPVADEAAGEFRIDDLVVHGADVRYVDETVDPPLAVPLVGLELDVKGLSSRALDEPVPLRVSAFLEAGNVPVPVRLGNTSLLRGLAVGSLEAVRGTKEEVELEERPLFQQLSLNGRFTLVPHPRGWVRASLTAFELVGLRGLARSGGVELGDGLVDANVRVRLNGERGAHVDALASVAYLKLSEPDGGPISRYLRLPAPLDTVLFALENEQGEHRIPLEFDVGEGGSVSGNELALEASNALLGMITEALASAPVRTVGAVTDVVGLGGLFGGGERKPKYAGLEASIPFVAGGVRVGPTERARLSGIVEGMRADPLLELVVVHAFAVGDLERAEQLASPQSEEARFLLRSLRLRRSELVRTRDELSASARAQLLLGQSDRFEATREELVEVARELGLTESGIDRVADLLRPGAASRRDRRTREAALAIADARMDALMRALLDEGVPYEQIVMRQPRAELSPEGDGADRAAGGRIDLVTRGGTPPKGFFRRMLGWIGL